MKLLLTSAGITNKSIANALLELLGKPFNLSKLLYIPTAANPEADKSYVESDFNALKLLNFASINTFDIASADLEQIETVINDADIIWFSGGNTFYLLDQLHKSGLSKTLPQLLNNKIYGGVSAGSIVATPNISVAFVEPADTNGIGLKDFTGLSLVDFEVSPHSFGIVSIENVEKYSKNTANTVYAIDDNGAILINDDIVKIVGEGKSKVLIRP